MTARAMLGAPGRALERLFPEKRLFLRSEDQTRFVRLTPWHQLAAVLGIALLIGWTAISTAFLLFDSLGSGSLREQARREQALYESRLNELSRERDLRAQEAAEAEARFNAALAQISTMQLMLLHSEDRRKEMETGLEVVQAHLRETAAERDAAEERIAALQARLEEAGLEGRQGPGALDDAASAIEFLSAALDQTARQRDTLSGQLEAAQADLADLRLEQKLLLEKNERIFSQLEDAVSLSLEPLDKMFESVGLSPQRILNTIRQGYSGQGGPLTPVSFSTRGVPSDPDTLRANEILARLDQLNLYRIAAQKVPLTLPVRNAFRYTSGFGMRWGRMHEGLDMAAPIGTPIYATADGVVTFAGTKSGYGLVTIIRHDFGIETRYAHQSRIRVKVGQKVSRGERIGDMGSTGHSTGSHVHYEVRVNGKPVNPMKFIKAGKDVF